MSWPDVTVVDACVRRDGRGGSPTAVTDDDPAATDADRRAVAAAAGTSHAAFLGPGRTPDGGRPVRFFTSSRCVTRRRTSAPRSSPRFGLTADDPHPTDAPRIAAPGAPRMLVPVHDRSALLRVCPHLGRLTAACRRYGLLGCFVYVPPVGDRPGAARMFAPAIGVDEDVANANSTGCLAAHLLDTTGAQTVVIEVEQGDTLGRPAGVLASARRGPAGITTRVGGLAVVRNGHFGDD
jgi:predicted PhzF superfamily epimerase YddE/YHI9